MDYKIKNTIKCEDLPIVISDDDSPKSQVKKSNKCKGKRKVLLKTKEKNIETLIVSQKVKVKNQNIKCVINLNTNVFDDTEERSILPKDKTIRIVPTCGRNKCKAALKSKRIPKERNRKQEVPKQLSKMCNCKQTQSKNHKKHYTSKKQQICKQGKMKIELSPKYIKTDKRLSLSPISLSPLKNDEMSYDSISTDSFTSCSEIDTLIRRAKQRESNSLTSIPLFSSTLQDIIDISSEDETLDVDNPSISIQSLATLILEPAVDSLSQQHQCYSSNITLDENLNSVKCKMVQKHDPINYSVNSFQQSEMSQENI